MSKIELGRNDEGKRVTLDISKLVEGRALIEGNSGAGKSEVMRTIIEQAHQYIQIVVVDPEDEFVTLREVMPNLLIIGASGEAPAQIKTAALLARKVVENSINVVLALNSLTPADRQVYVKVFIEAMMAMPKKYWHPILVFVDEAHTFCPQKVKVESKEAVIILMSQGRKRGFTGILATQRLSKLDKDSFETNNVWMGRVWQPTDQKASAEILGIDKSETQAMRKMPPGEFYAIGPAFNHEGKMQMNRSQTKKPEAGKDYKPPSSTSIKDVVALLGDLPMEAQAQDDLLARLQGEVVDLKRQVTQAQGDLRRAQVERPAPERVVQKVEVPVIDKNAISKMRLIAGNLGRHIDDVTKDIQNLDTLTESLAATPQIVSPVPSVPYAGDRARVEPIQAIAAVNDRLFLNGDQRKVEGSWDNGNPLKMGPGEIKILSACAQYPNGLERNQLSVMTAYKRSSRDTYINRLQQAGALQVQGGKVLATQEGIALLGDKYQPLPVGHDLQLYWMHKLSGGEKAILSELIKAWPDALERTTLDDLTIYKRSSRDTYLNRLTARELVTIPSAGRVKASDQLFEGGR